MIVLCEVDVPLFFIKKINEKLVDFRAGIDEKGLMVLDFRGNGWSVSEHRASQEPLPGRWGERCVQLACRKRVGARKGRSRCISQVRWSSRTGVSFQSFGRRAGAARCCSAPLR